MCSSCDVSLSGDMTVWVKVLCECDLGVLGARWCICTLGVRTDGGVVEGGEGSMMCSGWCGAA
jgi:hypothetical protein